MVEDDRLRPQITQITQVKRGKEPIARGAAYFGDFSFFSRSETFRTSGGEADTAPSLTVGLLPHDRVSPQQMLPDFGAG